MFNDVTSDGGPFRAGEGKGEAIVRGSASPDEFLGIFERFRRRSPKPPLPAPESLSIKALKRELKERRVSTVGAADKDDLVRLLRAS